MDSATVSVAVVTSRTEAELIAGMLRSHGVSAAVSADDAGGQYPQMQVKGVRVLVAPRMKPRPVGSSPSPAMTPLGGSRPVLRRRFVLLGGMTEFAVRTTALFEELVPHQLWQRGKTTELASEPARSAVVRLSCSRPGRSCTSRPCRRARR